MKKLVALAVGIVMAVSMAACSQQSPAPDSPSASAPASTPAPASESTSAAPVENNPPVTLIYSICAVPGDAHAEAQKEFKKVVEAASGGNITVEVYDSGTLFNQDTETAAVIAGDADIIYSSAAWLTNNSPWVSMFTTGYMFTSYSHMTKVLNGDIGKEVFAKIAKEQGILPLGAYYLGTRQISLSADKAIKTPADLNGVNLRMPNSEAWVFLGKAMGANPTPIAFNDLYLALQTGTVDGQDNPLPTVESAKFYEVQKSISLTNHLVDSVWPTINLKKWESLTDQQKGWVMEGIEAGRKVCDDTNNDKESKLVQTFKERGLSIYEADVKTFAKEVLQKYLDNPEMTSTWDMTIFDKVQAIN